MAWSFLHGLVVEVWVFEIGFKHFFEFIAHIVIGGSAHFFDEFSHLVGGFRFRHGFEVIGDVVDSVVFAADSAESADEFLGGC